MRGELRCTARVVALGGTLGVAASLVAARALRSFLFEVGPGDPVSLALAALLLVAAGLGAAWVPASRAGRADPIRSFRAGCPGGPQRTPPGAAPMPTGAGSGAAPPRARRSR